MRTMKMLYEPKSEQPSRDLSSKRNNMTSTKLGFTTQFTEAFRQRLRDDALSALENEPAVPGVDREKVQERFGRMQMESTFTSESTTIYSPRIDGDIAPAEFVFTVPGSLP